MRYPHPRVFCKKSLQTAENKGRRLGKEDKERQRVRKLLKIKGKWRVASDEWRDTARAPHTGGNADGCEKKGVAGKGICKNMKTKEQWRVASGEIERGDPHTPGVLYGCETKRVAGKGVVRL
jgi:hypothetical protein